MSGGTKDTLAKFDQHGVFEILCDELQQINDAALPLVVGGQSSINHDCTYAPTAPNQRCVMVNDFCHTNPNSGPCGVLINGVCPQT